MSHVNTPLDMWDGVQDQVIVVKFNVEEVLGSSIVWPNIL